jgi:hypothetical protein
VQKVERTTESETVQSTKESSVKMSARKTESKMLHATVQTTEPQMGQSAEQRLVPLLTWRRESPTELTTELETE